MEHLFSALAFAGLIAAQFLAVVFVAHEHSKLRSSDTGTSSDDARDKTIWLFSEEQLATQIHARGGLAMSRNIAAAAAVGLTAATFIILWSGLVRVEPETATTVARADAAAVAAQTISPFDIMMRHGKDLP